jgi:protease IV
MRSSLRPLVLLRPLPCLVVLVAMTACASPAAAKPAPQETAAESATGDPVKVVELVLSGDVSEDPAPQNPLGPSPRNFRSRLVQLRQIAADPEVVAVRLKLKGTPDFAHALDLLEELRAVKAAGKKVICYAETLDQRDLVFASLADLLVVPPGGAIVLEGLQAEVMYLKDLLAKLHVRFEVLHVGNYKNAFEDLARNEMSAEQREVIGLLLDEYWNQMLETIAENRGMPRGKVEELYASVLVEPQQAVAAGLIDAVGYEQDFDRQVEALLGGKSELEENYGDKGAEDLEKLLDSPFAAFSLLPKLLNPPKLDAPDAPHIAIVYATGPISSGKSKAGWDGKVAGMGSDTIVEALEEAAADDNAKAVVLRVNSPGGSALASDQIWGAIQRCKAKKPVIASMGNVAASGGYWISMGCSAIVAQPSTITGSMGVVSMLPDLSDVFEQIGVNVEVVARGPHGDQLSLLKHGPSPLLKEVITRSMQKVYGDFIRKASEGRRMESARIEELARGRVWTGRQAEELGLVDQLGGLHDAYVLACVMGGGLDSATTLVAEYPQPPSLMDAIKESFEGMASASAPGGAAAALAALGEDALLARAAAGMPALRSLLAVTGALLDADEPLSPDRVQCVLPFAITVR